jgi:hypothetical protein
MLCGKESQAFTQAERGVSGEFYELHSNGFAGAYARWLAVLSGQKPISDAQGRIERLFEGRDQYDLIDQIEIIAARAQIRGGVDRSREAHSGVRLLKSLTLRLPPSATALLPKLGLRLAV